jgi:hypothetical protein
VRTSNHRRVSSLSPIWLAFTQSPLDDTFERRVRREGGNRKVLALFLFKTRRHETTKPRRDRSSAGVSSSEWERDARVHSCSSPWWAQSSLQRQYMA